MMVYHVEIAGKGGITQYTYNLVTHLKKRRQNAPVGILGAQKYELENAPRNFTFFPLFNRFKTNPLRLLRFLIFQIQHDDIVHFQLSSFPLFVLSMIVLLKSTRRPHIVVTVHNVVSHETTFITRHILLRIYRLADHLIVHARENKEALVHLFRIPESKISIIPHGNYLFARNPETAMPERSQSQRFELLFFGFIRPYKGLDILLKSLKIVTQKHPNVLLHIVGKPHESFDKYSRLIESLHLERFVNEQLQYVPIEEIQRYFSQADVVVLPYKNISQSGVVFMAYAFGKPVIASRIGGLPEVIEDGKSGLLVPPEDEQALAQAILELMDHPERIEQMGAYALKLSQSQYSWQAIADRTWRLYDQWLK